jgi:hypothetical protein
MQRDQGQGRTGHGPADDIGVRFHTATSSSNWPASDSNATRSA